MKFINSLQGTYGFTFSADEVAPDMTPLMRDVVTFIGDKYDFSLRPEVPVGLQVDQMYTFQSGAAVQGKEKIAIRQLILFPNGWALTAKDTDLAETLTKGLISELDDKFGFKFSSGIKASYYMSFVTVEFSPGLEQQVMMMGRIKNVLEREIKRPEYPFDVKRLAFGATDNKAIAALQSGVEGMAVSDFIIERRAGEEQSANRYFCTAPLKTQEHLRVLALVEDVMQN